MAIQDIIFDSATLGKQHVAQARKIQNEPGIRWGIEAMDRQIIPSRGGDVSIILGRPGDGKTSLLCYLASHESANILGEGLEHDETVVYCTWEGTVDKIYAALMSARANYSSTDFYWGRVPIEQVEQTASLHGFMPVTMIGFSTFRQTTYRQITLDMILEAVEAIQAGEGIAKKKVRALILDYAQLIPVPGARDRTERVAEAIVGCKNIGMRLDIPSFVAAQAGRQVDGYTIKLAGRADAQWSSQLEQHTDYGYSIWRPINTEPYDPNTPNTIDMWGRHIPITPELFIAKNWKQRGEAAGAWWPLYFRPELCMLAEMELEVQNLEGY
jgi:replicative DNA helicase